MKLIALAAATALTLVAGSAMALPIIGTASIAGGFDALSTSNNAIVSDLNFINVNNTANGALLTGTTGAFSPNGFATASDFTISPFAPGMIYRFNGFTFTVESIAALTRTPLSCTTSGCNDSLGFDIFGSVTGNGFDATMFSGAFTANGTCNQQGNQTRCANNTRSGSYSASLVAAGQVRQQIPEPGSLALVALALTGLGVASRRKTQG